MRVCVLELVCIHLVALSISFLANANRNVCMFLLAHKYARRTREARQECKEERQRQLALRNPVQFANTLETRRYPLFAPLAPLLCACEACVHSTSAVACVMPRRQLSRACMAGAHKGLGNNKNVQQQQK